MKPQATRRREPTWARWALGAILLVAAALYTYGMTADLPYTRQGVEQLHIQLAVKNGTGDLNPHFFIHPPLLSYLLFILYGIAFVAGRLVGLIPSLSAFERLYFTDPTLFYLIARSFMVLVALGSVLGFYVTARRLFGTTAALIATALMAIAPEMVRWSHYAVPTVFMACLFMATFVCVTRLLEGKATWRTYIVTGLLGGIATAAKYDGALIAFPLITAHALAPRGRRDPRWWRDPRLFTALVCMGVAFVAGTVYLVLDLPRFFRDWSFLYRTVAYGDLTAPGSRITKPGGLFLLLDVLPFGWGLPLTLLGVAGVVHALIRRRREDLVLVGFILVALAYMSRWQLINSRYFVHIAPFMILLGVDWLIGSTARLQQAWGRVPVLVGLTAALAAAPLAKSLAFDRKAAQRPLAAQAKAWIESNLPSGTPIVTTIDLPLVPTEGSIRRQLEEIERKRLGQGVQLRRLLRYLDQFPATYDVTHLAFPSMGSYDEADFDFAGQVARGVRYFVLDLVVEEYRAEPEAFRAQVRYIDEVERHCELVKEFRGPWVDVVPQMVAREEYLKVYRLREPVDDRRAETAERSDPASTRSARR